MRVRFGIPNGRGSIDNVNLEAVRKVKEGDEDDLESVDIRLAEDVLSGRASNAIIDQLADESEKESALAMAEDLEELFSMRGVRERTYPSGDDYLVVGGGGRSEDEVRDDLEALKS